MCDEEDMWSLPTIDTKSMPSQKSKKIKHGHQYYINKFINRLQNDDDSVESSQDDGIYDHIKCCKYCRMQINCKLKMNLTNSPKEDKNKIVNEHFNFDDNKIFGYDLKEILLIIVAGIIIICVIDLIVKLSRKI